MGIQIGKRMFAVHVNAVRTNSPNLNIWHRRSLHTNPKLIEFLSDRKLVDGLKLKERDSAFHATQEKF